MNAHQIIAIAKIKTILLEAALTLQDVIDHKEKDYKCSDCAQVFINDVDLQAHKFNNKHCPTTD